MISHISDTQGIRHAETRTPQDHHFSGNQNL